MSQMKLARDVAIGDLDQLPPTLDVATAARYLGGSRNWAYEAIAAGVFPCRVLRIGTKIRILTSDLVRVLGLIDPGDLASADRDNTAGDDGRGHAPVTSGGGDRGGGDG